MLEALATALAQLVALEARFTELVEPEKAIFDAVRGVVKEITIVVPQLVEKVAALEARVAEIEQHPSLSIPALDKAPSPTGPAIISPLATPVAVGSVFPVTSRELAIIAGTTIVDAPVSPLVALDSHVGIIADGESREPLVP